MALQHNIRKQTIAIEVTSEALALELQPRLGDFNRQYLLPVMERVFDDLSEQGWQIRISKLDLDLGDVPFDRLEEVAPERFNSELRRALEEALRRQQHGQSAGNYSQTLSASRLELFEYYLREGTLPFWASGGSVFSFEQLVAELAADQSDNLARVIKQHSYQSSTLERIVLQLGEAALRRLLQVLEPKYAALIIACLTDLRLIHRVEPVVELSENEFARSLWILVLTYVLREPGSQFNRKTLVESLLEGIARAEGVDYQQIGLALDLGLKQTMKSCPLESSLPAIVSEITNDLNLDAARAASARPAHPLPGRQPEELGREVVAAHEGAHYGPTEAHPRQEPNPLDGEQQSQAASPLQLLEHYLLYGSPFSTALPPEVNLEEFLMGLAETDPAGLVRVIREHGRHRRIIESLAFQLGEQALRRLAHLLEPEYAALILSYLADLRAMHRVEPVIIAGGDEFDRSLWILTLGYLSHERGSQFNRKSFVKSLFEELAQSEGLDCAEILAMAQFGLRHASENRSLESSLPAIIGELISEHEERGFPSDMQDTVEDAQRAYTTERKFTPSDVGLRLSDALAQLESYLAEGHEAPGDLSKRRSEASSLLRHVALHDAAKARQLIWQFARRYESGLPNLVDCLLRLFPPVDLLAALAPEQKQFILAFAGVVRGVRAQVAPASHTQGIVIDDLFWKATLEYLLSDSSGRWNRRAMVRQIVGAVAEGVMASPVSLADTLAEALEQTVGTVESSLVRAVKTTRHDLIDQSHSTVPAPPAFGRYDHVEAIRYYLRYGVLPWSALLRNPKMTAASVLNFLPRLPRSLLYAVFTGESQDEQLQMLGRAVRMMSEESILQLLRVLLTGAKEPESPFRSALSAFASRVDKQAFYARLLWAILNGRPLDLEQLAASAVTQPITIETVLAGDPVQWSVDVLKSALLSQRRFGQTGGGEYAPFTLFDALFTRYPKDARHFCRALRDTPSLLAALTQQYSIADFDRLLDLLRPGDLPTLKAMTRAIAGLPAAHSHSAERVHEVILAEVLRLEESEVLQDSFFKRVLAKLFDPLAGEPPTLLGGESTPKWAGNENLPLAEVTASATITDGSSRGPTIRKPAADREGVFGLLLDESRKSLHQSESCEEAASPVLELLSDDALSHTLTLTLEESREDVYSLVTRQVQDSRVREHWAKNLPESALARLSYLLEPQRHRSLLDTAEVLASAWLEAIPYGCCSRAERQEFWSFVLKYLDRNANAHRSVEGLVAAFFQAAATRYRAAWSPEAPDILSVGTRMLECAGRLAGAAGHVGLHAVLLGKRKLLLTPWEPSSPTPPSPTINLKDADQARSDDRGTPPRPEPHRMAFSMEVEEENKDTGQPVYINNAGLVLTSPFLPHLFETLDLLRIDKDGRTTLRDRGAVSRAVHLLQYLVDGCTSAPEPLLALNKILCGVPISAAVDREIEPTEEERANCQRLLRAMIANWTTISNTSISGLQETFFRREGKLERRDEEWKLRIQRKTVDVLVDQVPWTVSVIYNSWMPQPLYVDW